MALRDAVLEVADAMDLRREELIAEGYVSAGEKYLLSPLKQFADELRRVVKASGEIPIIQTAQVHSPIIDHTGLVDKYRAEFRKNSPIPAPLEVLEAEPVTRYLRGGWADGDMVPTPAGMPVGAHTPVGPDVYTLREDGELHFNEEQSRMWKEAKAQEKKG